LPVLPSALSDLAAARFLMTVRRAMLMIFLGDVGMFDGLWHTGAFYAQLFNFFLGLSHVEIEATITVTHQKLTISRTHLKKIYFDFLL
jgi:hypothetical protein